jgi:hypothetical protein
MGRVPAELGYLKNANKIQSSEERAGQQRQQEHAYAEYKFNESAARLARPDIVCLFHPNSRPSIKATD